MQWKCWLYIGCTLSVNFKIRFIQEWIDFNLGPDRILHFQYFYLVSLCFHTFYASILIYFYTSILSTLLYFANANEWDYYLLIGWWWSCHVVTLFFRLIWRFIYVPITQQVRCVQTNIRVGCIRANDGFYSAFFSWDHEGDCHTKVYFSSYNTPHFTCEHRQSQDHRNSFQLMSEFL